MAIRIINDPNKERKALSVIIFGLMILFSFLEYDSFFQIQTYIVPAMLVVITAFFELLLFYKGRISFIGMHKYLVLFLVLSILMLFAERYEKSVTYVLFYYVIAIFYYALTYRKWNVKEIKYIVNCYYYTGIITAALIITLGVLTKHGRYSINLFGTEPLEVNFLAALLCTPAIIACKRCVCYKSKIAILVNAIAFLTIIYGIFLTGSRAAFIAVVIGASMVLIYAKKNMRLGKRISFKARSIIVLFIIALVLYLAINYLPVNMLERFFLQTYNDSSNDSRLSLWSHSFEMLLNSPIVGFGHDSFRNKHLQLYGMFVSVHNTYLAILFDMGLAGFLFFILFLFYSIKDCFKKENRLLLSIVISVLFTSITINAILSLYFWINIIILYQCCSVLKNNTNVNVNDLL